MKSLQVISVLLCLCVLGRAGPAAEAKTAADARNSGLAWLTKNQAKNGSWGKNYTVAVTSFACLSYLAADDDPFDGPNGKALVRGLTYLMDTQKNGVFPNQGHTWIHGQGFGALALSEAAGRAMFCKTRPDMDMKKVRQAVARAVKVIADNQSTSGGWWYTRGSKGNHEGSTTVCAVQALVSAANYGIEIDQKVLGRGFEYLKRCQNRDGGFDYKLDNSPNTVSMKEGTAGGVATLGLMRKFDFAVMMNGYKFLLKIGPGAISKERFPYYGHFYGCVGMRLLGQELKSLGDKTDAYASAAREDILSWQDKSSAWPVMRWVKDSGRETNAYATAFASLILSIEEGRLSIFNRKPPKPLGPPGGLPVAVARGARD